MLAAAVQWEAAVLQRADLVLAPSPHEAALLAAVAQGTRVLVRPTIAAAQPAAPPPLAARVLARRTSRPSSSAASP